MVSICGNGTVLLNEQAALRRARTRFGGLYDSRIGEEKSVKIIGDP